MPLKWKWTAVALVGLANTALAAPVVINGTYVGQAGAPGSTDYGPPLGHIGNNGMPAFSLSNVTGQSFEVTGGSFTGGAGGAVTGADATQTYRSGHASIGFSAGPSRSGPTTTIVRGGTFVGGAGGTLDGVGYDLMGGLGGSGMLAGFSTAIINGGTFIGGDSGRVTGTATNTSGSDFAGSGLETQTDGLVTINGGTFTGGNAGNGMPQGYGIDVHGGDVAIHGGTFTGGIGLVAFFGNTTLYGRDFAVDGVPVADGPITGSGTLTGTLQNNAGPTSTTFYVPNYTGSTLRLVSVPEPALSALLLMGPAALLRRRHRCRRHVRGHAAE